MKTACIYHSIDLDGWMSAACVKHYHKLHPGLTEVSFIGYNYGDPIPNLQGFDEVIMVDICLPVPVMEGLFLSTRGNLVWIDHHISAITQMADQKSVISGIRNTQKAACELTWDFYFPEEPMPEIVRLLGRYDCFGHKGTFEETKVLEFQYGARSFISGVDSAYAWLVSAIHPVKGQPDAVTQIHDRGKGIYQFLCLDAEYAYKTAFEVRLMEPYDGDKFVQRKFLAVSKDRFNPINFGINYHEEGYDGFICFHMLATREWSVSFYNDNGRVDCSAIARTFGGGGHKGAAGCRVNDIRKIIGE